MLFFDINRLKTILDPILEEFRNTFSWSEATLKSERETVNKAIAEATLKNL
jgi:hypothetical protein